MGERTRLGGEVAVDWVTRLLVGEVLHGLKRRRTCWKTKEAQVLVQPLPPTFMQFSSEHVNLIKSRQKRVLLPLI